MKKRIDAKTKIKQSAMKLFNEKNSLSITTNHIAKQAGISPGNLYYHYKNKEEIILDLYKELSLNFVELNSFEKMLMHDNFFEAMDEMFNQYAKLFFEYRFLLRDATVLIAMDSNLKKAFTQNQEIRIKQIEGLLKYLIKEGLIKELNKSSLNKRAKLHWFITAYWQSFVSTIEDVTLETLQESKEVFFEFMIYPNLTQKGKDLIRKMNK
ncbi:TetR/AcrR family transcriptional regulator [Arcobacter roscoffensis]|uniref:TetR/AcrR family transcriptional regulator n=1 Tax=Arcobacter roscoffensis TaxID=2961520 RepID=A0ABY5E5F3_9BACT|nr:TetR/AcrR family transcriptional regulator [Arcobacter roscoffensis]UTJ07384.1 TetR/AcrR family transcriptional regulator [Arcobacter roscoffensis]